MALKLFFSFVYFICCVNAWENDDLELFDLVEEINQNFYNVLGVTQDASSSDIRKAYRKLSLQIHPDKNKDEDAEEKFRQLVAMYEVLKDKEKRQRYDHILEFGLPDWRQPVYYFRKVRKLGLIELSLILFCIFTVGHFLVMWAIYFERRFELEEIFKSRKKKDKKGRKAKQQSVNQEEEFEELLQEGLDSVPKPRLLLDLLPLKCVRGFISVALSIPSWITSIKEQREIIRLQKQEEEEERKQAEIEARLEREKKTLPRKRRIVQPEPESCEYQKPVSYTPVQDFSAIQTEQKTDSRKGPWTEEDDHLLAKAVAKYPGGTSQRWEKIGEYVGRPENVVIKMAHSMKTGYVKNVATKTQGITGELGEDVILKKGKTISTEISTRMENVYQLQKQQDVSESINPNTDADKTITLKKTKTKKSTDDTLIISNINSETHNEVKCVNDKIVPNGFKAEQSSSVGSKMKKSSSLGTGLKKRVNFNDEVKSISADALRCNNENTLTIDKVDVIKENGNLVWSQNQQKIFEWGLAQFPKGTLERWEKIADHIPGKTKDDCIVRFKYLAELVKKKRQEKQENKS